MLCALHAAAAMFIQALAIRYAEAAAFHARFCRADAAAILILRDAMPPFHAADDAFAPLHMPTLLTAMPYFASLRHMPL